MTELSDKRRVHTLGVRDTALALADRYGANPEKAKIAALAHDLYRGLRGEELNKTVKELGLPDKYLDNPNLAHGKIAAIMLEKKYGVEDRDILNAVSYHTTGRAGMSLLEKVIFIADFTGAERNYNGADEMKAAAEESLEKAMKIGLTFSIHDLINRSLTVATETLDAYNELVMNGK